MTTSSTPQAPPLSVDDEDAAVDQRRVIPHHHDDRHSGLSHGHTADAIHVPLEHDVAILSRHEARDAVAPDPHANPPVEAVPSRPARTRYRIRHPAAVCTAISGDPDEVDHIQRFYASSVEAVIITLTDRHYERISTGLVPPRNEYRDFVFELEDIEDSPAYYCLRSENGLYSEGARALPTS